MIDNQEINGNANAVVISVSNVTQQYLGGSFTAVDNISLDLRENEIVTFIGPSGCGKTTLLKIIAGINEESSGDINWGERDLSEQDLTASEVGYVPQFSIAFDELTIKESVRYALRLRVNKDQAPNQSDLVSTILDKVGLKELSDRKAERETIQKLQSKTDVSIVKGELKSKGIKVNKSFDLQKLEKFI